MQKTRIEAAPWVSKSMLNDTLGASGGVSGGGWDTDKSLDP